MTNMHMIGFLPFLKFANASNSVISLPDFHLKYEQMQANEGVEPLFGLSFGEYDYAALPLLILKNPGKITNVITDSKSAKEFVNRFLKGAKTRPMIDRKTGKIIGEITDDGKMVRYPHTDKGTPQKHWNLENKGTGSNYHIIIKD